MTLLLLTRNRRPWLQCALQCARAQSYQSREILVVSSGESVADLVNPGERNVHLTGSPNVGRTRNSGCEAARGSVIAHFDDDDFSAPGRIADQVARLEASGKLVTGYHSMKCTDGRRWWLYSAPRDTFALGTSLVYAREFWARKPFINAHVGEDNTFVAHARAARQLVTADAGDLMFFTAHADNTSPRQFTGNNWREL